MLGVPAVCAGYLWTRRQRGAAILLACMPVLAELVQFAVPAIGRTCSSEDLLDNYTGLLVGVALGYAASISIRSRLGSKQAK